MKPPTARALVLGVGTAGLDSVQTPAGSVVDVPGGSALYFGAAARHFADVALASIVGEDFPEATLRTFAGLGVDVSGIQRQAALSIAGEHRRPNAVFLGSTHPAVQRAALDEVESGLVVLDTMAHWIEDCREEVLELLARADVLLVNQEEAKLLSARGAPPLAAAVLREMGPTWVVIKRGPAGAMAFGPSLDVSVPAQRTASPVDPTGAGDAFAGGFVGTLAGSPTVDTSSVRRALGAGVVMGALAASSFSLDALLEVDSAEVARRVGT